MRFNFKKISALASSALIAVSSIGFAAAANYPAPFVVGGTADVAIVYGTGAGVSYLDAIEAGNVQTNLQSHMGSATTSTGGGSVIGESVELFSGGTKIYVNDSLNAVTNVLTKSSLPTVLKDESFSGNVDASITQTIDIGSNPKITYKKQPTSSDDPNYALETSTTSANYIYNATATFSKAINFTHADSEGESITLFGQKFTVGSATDGTDLVLLQSAEKLSLDSDNPSASVTIGGSDYTIELVSSSDTSATIKVTDSSGASESKEINEAASKKINGITIAVTNADETNLKLSASLVAGSEKVTLKSGSSVKKGEDDKTIKGTTVTFTGGTTAMTKLVVSITASASDEDAIKVGESFTDPVFGSFKLDFAGFNLPEDSTSRETISVTNSGDDKMEVTFTEHRGNEKTVMFAKNLSASMELIKDDDNRNLSAIEGEILRYQDYVVVGNEDEGYLIQLTEASNDTDTYTSDDIWFEDVFSGDTYETSMTAEGTGTLTVGGKSYTVTFTGGATQASEDFTVRVNFPDSTGQNIVIYPTIQTAKGARLAFYEPKTVDLGSWDGTNVAAGFRFPDGDGYTDVTAVPSGAAGNITIGGTILNAADESTTATIGKLTYNFTHTGTANNTQIFLQDVGGTNIATPALVIFEEKDDNNNYEALIVKLESGATSDDGIGVDDVERTWGSDDTTWESTIPGDSKIEKSADLWGTIITTDSSDSDQKSATISYPDEQIYAQLYMGEESSSVTAATTTTSGATQLGDVLVKDSEVASVSSKNLIVIGGSCINSVAAKALGFSGATCGSGFTGSTGVGPGQFLIQSVGDAYAQGKVALVVAGYEAADTVNAAKYLRTQTVDTSAGMKYKGTTSTSAELVTETTTA